MPQFILLPHRAALWQGVFSRGIPASFNIEGPRCFWFFGNAYFTSLRIWPLMEGLGSNLAVIQCEREVGHRPVSWSIPRLAMSIKEGAHHHDYGMSEALGGSELRGKPD